MFYSHTPIVHLLHMISGILLDSESFISACFQYLAYNKIFVTWDFVSAISGCKRSGKTIKGVKWIK